MSSKVAVTSSKTKPDVDGTPHDNRSPEDLGRRAIGLPAVDDLRILREDGVCDPELDPQLTPEELRRLHRAMVLTRKLDVRMLAMQRQGKMGTFAPGYGQEATQIGQVYPLQDSDWFAPSYRSFGAQLWRGWPIERLMLLWAGYFEGFPPPAGVNDLPFSIVIGSHVPPAVGIAMAMKRRGDPHVILTNFGDGALSQGVVAEAFNFAAVNASPIVFVCENNGWAISTPVPLQSGTEVLAQRAVGSGIPALRVDGNDILAMIVATREAAARARAGDGPTLIEAVTFRMEVHTTADDTRVYRSDAEAEAWKAKCPILRLERYLARRGVLDDAGAKAVAEDCEREVNAARDAFYENAEPNPREVFDFVYESMPDDLKKQRREYLTKLDRKLGPRGRGEG